jgi:hypothetical protein
MGNVSKRPRGASGGWRRNGRKVSYVNQGDLSRTAKVFMRRNHSVPKSHGTGVSVSVGAMKRGNSRGAKGHRKVDA